MAIIGNNFITVPMFWPEFIETIRAKNLSIQYDYVEDTAALKQYQIFALDNPIIYIADLWEGEKPPGVTLFTQTENDLWWTDFSGNYKAYSNKKISNEGSFNDPRMIHRFGNMTTTAVTERLISALTYSEQSSQTQRSVVSTNINDSFPSGSGAKAVEIVFLNSNYACKKEILLLSGTLAINTVNTDIRFIESFKVVQGAEAVGTINLKINTSGGGGTICSIGPATTDAFLCHHYVPTGSVSHVVGWGGVVNDDVNFKLMGQLIVSGNRTNQVLDLDNLTGVTAAARAEFSRKLNGVKIGEKCYIRITGVPGQVGSTITRAFLDIWESKGT